MSPPVSRSTDSYRHHCDQLAPTSGYELCGLSRPKSAWDVDVIVVVGILNDFIEDGLAGEIGVRGAFDALDDPLAEALRCLSHRPRLGGYNEHHPSEQIAPFNSMSFLRQIISNDFLQLRELQSQYLR